MKVLERKIIEPTVLIPHGTAHLPGELIIPVGAVGMVLFAHGSGSSRHSPRNQAVARTLQANGIGTLLFDLLTEEEEQEELYTRHLRFNIGLLVDRLDAATHWLGQQEIARGLPLGYFGSSTGAAAALVAAATAGDKIRAIVSRGGRPDLADAALPDVKAPTLLIVGARDEAVIEMNELARKRMKCECRMVIIPRATHLFEESGALEEVARVAANWFLTYLRQPVTH